MREVFKAFYKVPIVVVIVIGTFCSFYAITLVLSAFIIPPGFGLISPTNSSVLTGPLGTVLV